VHSGVAALIHKNLENLSSTTTGYRAFVDQANDHSKLVGRTLNLAALSPLEHPTEFIAEQTGDARWISVAELRYLEEHVEGLIRRQCSSFGLTETEFVDERVSPHLLGGMEGRQLDWPEFRL
jgi:hypothetical protein